MIGDFVVNLLDQRIKVSGRGEVSRYICPSSKIICVASGLAFKSPTSSKISKDLVDQYLLSPASFNASIYGQYSGIIIDSRKGTVVLFHD
jgi:hypothetical protein